MKEKLRSFVLLFVGSFLVAVGTYFFLAPNNIAAGGVSGIAIIINSIFPNLYIGELMLIMDVALLIIGTLIIGSTFGVKTVFCSLSISGIILIFEKIIPNNKPISDDILLQLIFGILICGMGMGIVFNQNASTGGTDIIAKIINKYFNISIGKSLLAADISITVAAALIFGLDKGLYSILGVLINATIIDKVISQFNSYKEVAIISCQGENIKEYIVNHLDRGATIYYAKGAYKNNESEVITTILNRKEFLKLKEFIKTIDEKAFITVNEVNEVLGEGFLVL